jgi:26S proteasome regulatory subunit N5
VQIFVEVERARVTRLLSDMKKAQGDINAATDILCELQVETFGSMKRREKTEFILQQVKLCIEKGDWMQAGILSRKISTKYFTRRPKMTPEQVAKEERERDEKEKNRNPDDPPIEIPEDVTDLKLSTTTTTWRRASTIDRSLTLNLSRTVPSIFAP